MYLLKSIFLTVVSFFILIHSYGQVVINEIQSSNSSSVADYQGEYSDWIELYNAGDTPVNLFGYGLSDESENPYEWVFPSISLNADEYLVVFASSKNTVVGTELHTNFKISSSGESIYLTNSEGILIDNASAIELTENQSYGRTSDGGVNWIVYSHGTPGGSNLSGIKQAIPLKQPQTNYKAGFYDLPLSITLTCPDNGASVYYSTDGSKPYLTYAQPVSISTSTVVKAECRMSGETTSDVKTDTYFIGQEHDLPVVSLSFNPDDFYGLDSGIYVLGRDYENAAPNYGANFWEDWERKVHFEYFVEEEEKVEQDLGVKIFGGWSRANPMKSLRLIPRSEYGNSTVDYPFFKDKPYLDNFDQLVLRNSGNDFNGTMWSDIQNHKALSSISDVDMMAAQPVVVFFNGEYKGLHNLRERVNAEYLGSNRDFSDENLDFLELNGGIELPNQVLTNETLEDQIKEGTNLGFIAMYEFIAQNDMTIPSNYEQAAAQLDMNSFIDYFAAQIYHINNDWPHNNVRFWRSPDFDGKWRYIYYDTEFGKGLYGSQNTRATKDELTRVINDDRNVHSMMFKSLLANDKFRYHFINRSADFMNTIYTPTNFRAIADELEATIIDEMGRHAQLYGGNRQNSLNTVYDFINARPSNARGDYTTQFGTTQNTIILNVLPEGAGVIKISTIIPATYPWTGVYYNNVPVVVNAMTNAGYEFSSWSGIESLLPSDTIIFSGTSTVITANFTETSTFSELTITEVNYHSLDEANNSGDWFELYNKGNKDIDLSGYVFRDEHVAHEFIFPAGAILEPGAYLVVTQDINDFKVRYPDVTNVIGDFDFGLGNSGDELLLFDIYGRKKLHLNYNDKAPWPTLADGKGASIELREPDLNYQLAENWKANCKYGSPGQKAIDCTCTTHVDLGEDILDCSVPLAINLNSSVTASELEFYWYKDNDITSNNTSYIVTKGGDYEVVVIDGVCMVSDKIKVIEELKVDLGADVYLCSPSYRLFDAEISVPGVNYQWQYDGVDYSEESTITANSPGVYAVSLTADGCVSVYDQVVLKSGGPWVENKVFCQKDAAATIYFNGDGRYEWFTSAVGGVSLGTNDSLNLENLVSDTVFYVQNNSFEQAIVGRTSIGDGIGKLPQTEALLFTVFNPMTLVAVSVQPQTMFGNTNVVVRVLDESNNLIKSVSSSVNGFSLNRIVLDLELAPGNYKIDAYGTSGGGRNGGNLLYENAIDGFPYLKEGIISITGNSEGTSAYYYFYNFEVEKGEQGCDRVPLYVTMNDCLLTSIFETTSPSFTCYPNPASRWLAVSSNVQKIILRTLDGRMLMSSTVDNHKIQLPELVDGFYIIELWGNEGHEIQKIQIFK